MQILLRGQIPTYHPGTSEERARKGSRAVWYIIGYAMDPTFLEIPKRFIGC